MVDRNYHTHIYRCNHAKGDIDDYINEARKNSFKTIGISCHMPYDDLDKYRMKESEFKDYINKLDNAKKAYDDIEILTGLECEYFKSKLNYYYKLKEQVDYLILGQHFIMLNNNLIDYESFILKEHIIEYANEIKEALETNLFSFVAHPDSFGLSYQNFDKYAIEATHIIASAAIDNNVAIELNCNGFRKYKDKYVNKYPYPLDKFWEIIAKDYKNIPVIINSDAHLPSHIYDEAVFKTVEYAKKYNLNVINKLIIK